MLAAVAPESENVSATRMPLSVVPWTTTDWPARMAPARLSAWLLDATQNDSLAGAMRAGQSVVVQGTTDKGILVAETFSLSGATAASKAIDSGC